MRVTYKQPETNMAKVHFTKLTAPCCQIFWLASGIMQYQNVGRSLLKCLVNVETGIISR